MSSLQKYPMMLTVHWLYKTLSRIWNTSRKTYLYCVWSLNLFFLHTYLFAMPVFIRSAIDSHPFSCQSCTTERTSSHTTHFTHHQSPLHTIFNLNIICQNKKMSNNLKPSKILQENFLFWWGFTNTYVGAQR